VSDHKSKPHSAALSLSISVVCYNSGEEQLRALIASLLASLRVFQSSTPLSLVTISLVDNSEDHNVKLDLFATHAEDLDSLGVELKLLQGQGNVGYGSAHNLVIRKSDADYHLILNPDVVLREDCLRIGIAYLEINTDVAMASPYAENALGQKQYLCKRYPSIFTFLVRGFAPSALRGIFRQRLALFEMHDLSESTPTDDVTIASGCFMLCRTDKLNAIHGFDENYFLYFEDFDLSLRLAGVGKIAYVPEMKIRHSGGNSANKGWQHIKMFARSGVRFFNTHGWRFFKQQ